MIQTSHDVKLIVFDVDGTLVDDNQVLGERTMLTIRQVQAQGIPVSLATGKIFPSVANLIKLLNIKVPVVLANGAIVQQPDQKIICGKFLDSSFVEEITQSDQNFHSELALFIPNNIYVEKETYNTEHITVEFKEKIEIIGQWSAVRDHFSQVCKAIWINRLNTPKLRELAEFLKRTYDGRISLSAGSPGSIEAMPVGVSKQTGLSQLIKYLHIPMNSVMVFGDQQNDYGMLNAAGIAVAVGNAIDSVKEISDYVIGTNNDEGPAKFLLKYFSL